MKKIVITVSVIVFILFIICFFVLSTNKTFFKDTYIGVQNQEIFIPKYSYFKNESGMTVASFYSLKSEKNLKKEIDNYMKDFAYFENESTHGYKRGDLFIQSYVVIDEGLFRRIYITY